MFSNKSTGFQLILSGIGYNKQIHNLTKEVIGQCIFFVVNVIKTIRLDKEYNMEFENSEKRRRYESVGNVPAFYQFIIYVHEKKTQNARAVRKKTNIIYVIQSVT